MEKRSSAFEVHIDSIVQKNAAAIERQKRADMQKKRNDLSSTIMASYLSEDDDASTVARGILLDKLAEEAKAHYEVASDEEVDDDNTIESDENIDNDPDHGIGEGPLWDRAIAEEYEEDAESGYEDNEEEEEDSPPPPPLSLDLFEKLVGKASAAGAAALEGGLWISEYGSGNTAEAIFRQPRTGEVRVSPPTAGATIMTGQNGVNWFVENETGRSFWTIEELLHAKVEQQTSKIETASGAELSSSALVTDATNTIDPSMEIAQVKRRSTGNTAEQAAGAERFQYAANGELISQSPEEQQDGIKFGDFSNTSEEGESNRETFTHLQERTDLVGNLLEVAKNRPPPPPRLKFPEQERQRPTAAATRSGRRCCCGTRRTWPGTWAP